MKYLELCDSVVGLARGWGISGAECVQAQYLKLVEEIGEVTDATNTDELIKEVGDVLVVVIIMRHQLGLPQAQPNTTKKYPYPVLRNLISSLGTLAQCICKGKSAVNSLDGIEEIIINALPTTATPYDALYTAYEKISKRTGKNVNGVFVKSDDL